MAVQEQLLDVAVKVWGAPTHLGVAEVLVNDDALHQAGVLHGPAHLALNLQMTTSTRATTSQYGEPQDTKQVSLHL
jgi:hypothetical protein